MGEGKQGFFLYPVSQSWYRAPLSEPQVNRQSQVLKLLWKARSVEANLNSQQENIPEGSSPGALQTKFFGRQDSEWDSFTEANVTANHTEVSRLFR